eukprot:SM000257S08652  [mRNA]  locus=s257:174441:174860:- [translate_table: standard]
MVAELYKEYDDSLQQSLASLLHSSSFPSASAFLQASLPTHMGGLGCRSLEQMGQAAFLGCWHQIASLLPMRFPCLHDPVRNVEEDSFPFQANLRSIRDSVISSFPSLSYSRHSPPSPKLLIDGHNPDWLRQWKTNATEG